jgi:hypothetical protein
VAQGDRLSWFSSFLFLFSAGYTKKGKKENKEKQGNIWIGWSPQKQKCLSTGECEPETDKT